MGAVGLKLKIWNTMAQDRNIEWTRLAKYQKLAAQSNEMHRVFVGSMMDIFEKPMPLIDHIGNKLGFNTGALRDDFFRLIGLGAYPNLMPLLLTKRPSGPTQES